MQKQFYKNKNGSYIILSLYLIVALLAVVGLAIDFANIYLKRVELQKALQSAVFSTLEARLSQDMICDLGVSNTPRWVDAYPANSSDPINNECRNKVENSLIKTLKTFLKNNLSGEQYNNLYYGNVKFENANLKAYFPYKLDNNNNPVVDASSGNYFPIDLIKIDATLKVKTLLMGFIPFEVFGLKSGFKEVSVTASAQGNINPANITLILDTSGSMACPSNANDCKLTANLEMYCSGIKCDTDTIRSDAKIKSLEEAVTAFLQKFRSGKDNIQVVPFQFFSTVLTPVSNNIPSLIEKIQKLPSSGLTNTSDALASAIEISLNKEFKLNTNQQFILFSDGPPTAGRFLMPVDTSTFSSADSVTSFAQWISQKNNPGVKFITPYEIKHFEKDENSTELSNQIVTSPWELSAFFNQNSDNISALDLVDITAYKLAMTGGSAQFFPGPLIHTPALFPKNSTGSLKINLLRTISGTADPKQDKWMWSNPADLQSLSTFMPFCTYVFPEDNENNPSCHDNLKWNYNYPFDNNPNCPNTLSDINNLFAYYQYTRSRCSFGDAPNNCYFDTSAGGNLGAILSAKVQSALNRNTSAADPSFMDNCFAGNSFSYYNPSLLNDSQNLPNTIDSSANSLSIESFSEKFYNSTIMFADHARRLGATIHSIGLGESSYSGCPTGTDPYQDVMDDFQRKDIFLSRIANAKMLNVIRVNSDGALQWNAPCKDLSSSDDWKDGIAKTNLGKNGYALATQDPQALTPIFLQLARKILLSLTPAVN